MTAGAEQPVVLRLSGIVKTFPGVRALDGVELEVRAGEVHCLLGQNGAGKSTLIKVMAGVHRPDAGSMVWQGEEVSFASPHAATKAGIATIYQELDLVDDLTVAENIFLGHADRLWTNELTVLTLASSVGVIAIGMTFVIISGGIDLSVGALLALASVWSTTVATQQFGVGVMLFTSLLVGSISGLVNGVLTAYGRLAPFIATLAMMVAARGLAQKISGKSTQVVHVEGITAIAQNTLLGIPWLVIIFAVVAALAWVLLNRTTFGRRTAAIGGNAEAARLAGISVPRTQVLIYILSGLCCGIAAVMVTAQANAGSSIRHLRNYQRIGDRWPSCICRRQPRCRDNRCRTYLSSHGRLGRHPLPHHAPYSKLDLPIRRQR